MEAAEKMKHEEISLPVDRDEQRRESIDALRAKAQEHCAKVMSAKAMEEASYVLHTCEKNGTRQASMPVTCMQVYSSTQKDKIASFSGPSSKSY